MPSQPSFVLVRPQMGENIGASARAMLNFGLDRLAVVSPRDGWPNPAAEAMASGAGRLLDAAQLFEDLPAALSNSEFVLATTARARGLTKPILSPKEAMQQAANRCAAGEWVSVLFGPERAGLENEDIARANAIISVPVNPEFPSLNLAQCVLLCGYEWRLATANVKDAGVEMAGAEWASNADVEALTAHYEESLSKAGFFFPEGKEESMKLNLRNMWSRMPLTRADVQTLHGVLRQMVRWKERG
ncbi:MAG: RNA methyltransferase [Pseudomonadota bacterium]